MSPAPARLLQLLNRPDFWEVRLPTQEGATWQHAGERISPRAHLLTEREVRAHSLLAAQPEALRLSR